MVVLAGLVIGFGMLSVMTGMNIRTIAHARMCKIVIHCTTLYARHTREDRLRPKEPDQQADKQFAQKKRHARTPYSDHALLHDCAVYLIETI